MVDTAVFSIFHRVAPAPVPPAPEPTPPPAPIAPLPADEVATQAAPPPEPVPAPPPPPPPLPPAPPPAEPQPHQLTLASPEPVEDLVQPEADKAPPPLEALPEASPLPAAPMPQPEPELEEAASFAFEPEIGAVPAGIETNLAPIEEPIDPDPAPIEEPAVQHAVQAAEPPAWNGPVELTGVAMDADQLGLANPLVITLLAGLPGSVPVALDASFTGIYQPEGFRAAPWSESSYDIGAEGRTGIAAGTRILTARGEMEVERLRPGDAALTLRSPALLPIAWIGKSSATAAPILIEAGALGPELPRRAVCVAADQTVYVDPVAVPASRLVNGTTIRAMDSAAVDLFHVDVGRAEILFAEGLPLSSGGRSGMPVVP